MRKVLIGIVFAGAISGPALASDYIVVRSTDPAIKRGQAFDAGAKVALGVGQSLTVMRPSGEVATLRGTASGVTLPGARMAASDAARFEALRSLVQPPPEGRTFGARRGGVCPAAEALTALDDILKTGDANECKAVARQALEAYLARTGAPND